MADITQNYQIKYSEKWGSYLQQEASRLEKYVTVESGLSGKMVAFDQYGLLSFTEKTDRLQTTVLDEAPTTRRVIYPKIYTKAIGFDEFDISMEDLIPEQDVVITKTKLGYIKRMTTDTFKSQNRGGKGIKGMQTLEEDYVEELFMTSSHHYIMFFTNKGKVYRMKGYEVPLFSRQSKGLPIINLLPLEKDEKMVYS